MIPDEILNLGDIELIVLAVKVASQRLQYGEAAEELRVLFDEERDALRAKANVPGVPTVFSRNIAKLLEVLDSLPAQFPTLPKNDTMRSQASTATAVSSDMANTNTIVALPRTSILEKDSSNPPPLALNLSPPLPPVEFSPENYTVPDDH
ncbi:hypothetical protein BC834DRAFT_908106 [Gloeopeniophorella convolvens]|nr:hypothetical protein BC834DRAFT_908106 [Gloeopeniophorella convolvens]